MAHHIDALDRQHRPFKRRQPVERERQDDEFQGGIRFKFLPRSRYRHDTVDHRRPGRREQDDAHHHA